MEKGILHIRKKPRHVLSNGKEIPIKKQVPEIGKEFDKLECEFEGNPVTKILVDGNEFSADLTALAARQEKAKAQEEHKKAYKEMQRRQEKNGDSFVLSKARVPGDTRICLIEDGDNFSLKLNQFARFEENFIEKDNRYDRKFSFFKGKTFQIKHNFGNLFDKRESQISFRQTQTAQTLFSGEGHLLKPIFKPEWRFVTGLGGHSVYETGITLHHIYGMPYIPASSIKGVLRSWVIFSKFQNKEKEALKNETFCLVFGCPTESVLKKAHQGKVTFFDALPTRSPKIEPDIMNPHYSDWYSGKEGAAPVDTDSPKPVFFLTVKDTPFQFLLGSKTWNLETEKFWNGETLGWWLENALSEHGIGAKTAVGYGYMTRQQ